jgi:hypothetical protein
LLRVLVGLMLGSSVDAQTFSSGSNGSYGPMNITKDTQLQLPPDGIFHCTTITVAAGATLWFKRNDLNTPVYLLARGDVNIAGTVDVSAEASTASTPGRGGPGGFDGGTPKAESDNTLGDGHGPGAGWYSGVQINRPDNKYMNRLLHPLIGGSGAAAVRLGLGSMGGGGGGGAILISSSTKVVLAGTISARPSGVINDASAYGGGGAIRIVTPALQASGGTIDAFEAAWAARSQLGRVRIDVSDRSALTQDLKVIGLLGWGSRMVVAPSTIPRLDIVAAAGNSVKVGAASSVAIVLPSTSDVNQPITLRATDFSGSLNVIVAVVPDHAASQAYSATLEMTTNPAEITIPIKLAPGMTNRILAWAE